MKMLFVALTEIALLMPSCAEPVEKQYVKLRGVVIKDVYTPCWVDQKINVRSRFAVERKGWSEETSRFEDEKHSTYSFVLSSIQEGIVQVSVRPRSYISCKDIDILIDPDTQVEIVAERVCRLKYVASANKITILQDHRSPKSKEKEQQDANKADKKTPPTT